MSGLTAGVESVVLLLVVFAVGTQSHFCAQCPWNSYILGWWNNLHFPDEAPDSRCWGLLEALVQQRVSGMGTASSCLP